MISFFSDFAPEIIDRAQVRPVWVDMVQIDTKEKDKIYRDDAIEMITLLAAKLDKDGKEIARQFIDGLKLLRSAG